MHSLRDFWFDMEVPPYVKRGEQLGVQISVFNRWYQVQEVRALPLRGPGGSYNVGVCLVDGQLLVFHCVM